MTGPARLTIDGRGHRQRIDRYLAECQTWGSRAQVQRLIDSGLVLVDGQPAKAGTLLRLGQVVSVAAPPPAPPPAVEAEDIPLAVVYEDAWLLVINKPPGLVVHPAPGHWHGTLVSALLHHWRGTPAGLDPLRPGIVHRLDKDTSGVLVIAKDPVTLAALGAQFRAREVEKEYVAFVWGRVRSRAGMIDEPIGRHRSERTRMAVRRGGREAVTAYRVVERFDAVTLLRLFPKTGRTHQLRVHLAAIGHPIVGDAVYGGGRGRAAERPLSRQALHAARLTLRHPVTGARMSFAAPLADDLVELRRRLANAP